MKLELPKVADTLVSQSSLFQCSMEDAWKKHMHPYLTESFSYDEVKSYIDNKIKLGEGYSEKLTVQFGHTEIERKKKGEKNVIEFKHLITNGYPDAEIIEEWTKDWDFVCTVPAKLIHPYAKESEIATIFSIYRDTP